MKRNGPRQQGVLFDQAGRPAVRDGKRLPKKRHKKRGPKPKGARPSAPHRKRPEHDARYPVHVVLRVVEDIGNLRKRHMYKALREASIAVAKRERHDLARGSFRIVHVSIQHDHIHLLVEAGDKTALSRGMQGFQISAAKHLNRAVSLRCLPLTSRERRSPDTRRAMARRRRGVVFPDRFHQVVITSPRQMRNTLAYVLNNWRKHREDRGAAQRTWNVDPYSTGVLFDGWKEREEAIVYWRWRDTYDPLVVYLPKTWLLRVGWRRHGLVRFGEVPSKPSTPSPAAA